MIKITGSKTRRILEELQHRTRTAKEIFEAIYPLDSDTFKITKRMLGYMTPPRKLTHKELRRLEQKRFYSLLAKLRSEGLVKKRGAGLHAKLRTTARGLQKLLRKNEKQKRHDDLPNKIYLKKKIRDKLIIIFDIPESRKHCRDWIRYQLKLLGFIMLQKSVFIGAYQLPADFLHDLRESNMLKYIHVFKITQSGSLD